MESRTKGLLSLLIFGSFFLYYTLWVVVLPFVDKDYKGLFEKFFPPVELALGLPALVGTVVGTALLARAYCLVQEDRRQEERDQKKQN